MKDQPDYSSMEWDGKQWNVIDPQTGQRIPQRLTRWSRLPVWGKALALAGGLVAAMGAAWLGQRYGLTF